jgi:hypothetical protein
MPRSTPAMRIRCMDGQAVLRMTAGSSRWNARSVPPQVRSCTLITSSHKLDGEFMPGARVAADPVRQNGRRARIDSRRRQGELPMSAPAARTVRGNILDVRSHGRHDLVTADPER